MITPAKRKAKLTRMKARLDALSDRAVSGDVLANELYQVLYEVVELLHDE